jgi:hypothetical protein
MYPGRASKNNFRSWLIPDISLLIFLCRRFVTEFRRTSSLRRIMAGAGRLILFERLVIIGIQTEAFCN